jgi:hypothetical protein
VPDSNHFWRKFRGSGHAPSGNCIISGGINNGLQIQNCPVVEQAPTPTFHVVKEFPIAKNGDGTFTRSILIEIDAPYVPGNMVVFAKGATVVDLDVASGSSAMIMGKGKTRDGIFWFQVGTPWDKYTVSVKTSEQIARPALQIAFNHKNPS